MKGVLVLFSFIAYSLSVCSQSMKQADEYFELENYPAALDIYKELIKNNPEDYKLNFRLGVCHLNASVIKSKAISYLNKAASFSGRDPIAYYLLGRAYHYSYQFDPAIRAYEKFISLSSDDPENLAYAKKKIEYCYNAKEFMKFPLNLTFENLGDNINSEYPDFFPFVSSNESFMVFNSKRDDGSNKLNDGSFSSNIYISNVEKGQFQKAHKLTDLGVDSLNERVIGLSPDGSKILYSIQQENGVGIYLADFKNREIKNSELLNLSPKEVLNSGVTASINSEANTIYLSANLKNSYGGHDIYVARMLPNGEWSLLQNMGPAINTVWDEKYPNISHDGKVLYFSSEGHTGLGGMDVYESRWDTDSSKWINVYIKSSFGKSVEGLYKIFGRLH